MFLRRFCGIMGWVMEMEERKYRKTTRLKSADYNSNRAVFLTICTKERRCILSRIVGTSVLDGPKIELTEYGKIAEKYINQLNNFYNDLSVESYVIMPNHIHILLWVKGNENGPSRVSLRFGHARVLTPHRGVIHYAPAASLRRSLQFRIQFPRSFYQLLKDFAIKNVERIFGNIAPTIILSAIARITKNICDISTKILLVGAMMNCISKNRD